jgi:opacity protein-like surface antigen
MKRSLALAVSVLALTAVSETLFAAESETPAPIERAAPAAERAPAPAAERAPAPERRARPAQRQVQPRQQTSQATSQSTQQTWTGAQGGGFGGGNVGGAGFSDNVCPGINGAAQSSQFSQSPPFQSSSPNPQNCLAINSSHPSDGSGTFGGYFGWGTLIPGTGFYLGAEAMVSGNRVNHTDTLNQSYPGQLPGEFTTDSRTATTHIGTSYSGLVRFGGLITDKTLIYFSGGSATANVSATFTQSAIATIPSCSFGTCTTLTTLVAGSSSVSKTVTGYALGGGVEIAYLPNIKIRVQYMHMQFPDVSFVTPLAIAACQSGTASTCTPGAESNRVSPSFNQFTVGVGFSLF